MLQLQPLPLFFFMQMQVFSSPFGAAKYDPTYLPLAALVTFR